MQPLPFHYILDKLDDYDLLLFDLWGVIIEDEKFYPGVIDAINEILKRKKCFFVSNAPRPNFVMEDKLKSWGLKGITKEIIITSGDIARSVILEKKGTLYSNKATIYHLGEDQNDDILRNFDHIITDDYKKADVFLISMFRDHGQNIREFDNLLINVAKEQNLLKICSNPDISIPKGDSIRYCAGYFARIVEENNGQVLYTGKPKKIMYDYVLARAGNIPKNRILMIGDTFETDILGAQEAGIHSALVMTGNAAKAHVMCNNLQDKISSLTKEAMALGAVPTFITQIAK